MADYHRDQSHFVDLSDVAQVDAVTRVVDVFNILAGRTTSIVMVHHPGPLRWYVNGRKLAEEFLGEAQENDAVYGESIRDFLKRRQRLDDPTLVVTFSKTRADILASGAPAIPLGATAPKRNVYCVTRGDVLEGLLFSHESFKRDAFTPPAKFICELDHENDDPDHGYCRRCPFKIVSVR